MRARPSTPSDGRATARLRLRRMLGVALLIAGSALVLHSVSKFDATAPRPPSTGAKRAGRRAAERRRVAPIQSVLPAPTEPVATTTSTRTDRRGVRLVAADDGSRIDDGCIHILRRTNGVTESSHAHGDAPERSCDMLHPEPDGVLELPARVAVTAIASAPGFADARISISETTIGVFEFALHRSRIVHIRTVDDATGRGLVSEIQQRVRRGLGRARVVARTSTDAGGFGAVSVERRPGVTTTLVARTQGYDAASTTLPATSSAGASVARPVQIRLVASCLVTVVVRDARTGRGVADARLLAHDRIVALSDATGTARVPAPVGGYAGHVRVTCDGYGDELLLLPSGSRNQEDLASFVVEMSESWSIDGVVTDERRAPIAGATVWFEARAVDRTGVASVTVRRSAVSDTRGAYRLADLPPRTSLQRARLGATAPDGRRSARAIGVRPRGPVDIVLDRTSVPVEVEFAVVGTDGRPVQDAEIGAWFVAGEDPSHAALVAQMIRGGLEYERRSSVVDSASGVARVELHEQPGVWMARAWSPDAASPMVIVVPRAGRVELHVDRLPIVSGSLRRPGGADVTALYVDVVRVSDGRVLAAGSSGPDGAFDFALGDTLRPDDVLDVRVRAGVTANDVLATSSLRADSLDRRLVIDVARR